MLVGIFTSPASKEPMCSHESIQVLANSGLEGDRYATGKGYYSGMSQWDAHVTLVRQEPFDTLAAEHGGKVEPKELRRNLVTRGIDLLSLIGKNIRIGEQVILRVRKPWPPCSHLVSLSGLGEVFKQLARHCGIGASVLVGGQIRLGDSIVVDENDDTCEQTPSG